MNKAVKLASRICDAMERKAPRAALAPLARDYLQLCEEANHRLEQCAAMIGHGQNYQALELAETAPPLLDLVAALSFRESQDWRLLCQQEDLPVAEKLDELSIRKLNDLYSRGGVGQRRLYKQYRHNILEHNHRAAIRTLRTLCKVDPRDTNARSELERLDRSVTGRLVEKLEEAVECGIQDRVVNLMEDLESEPWLNAPSGGALWDEANRIRTAQEKAAAVEECTRRIGLLKGLKQENRWQETLSLIEEVEDRARELGIDLGEHQLLQLKEAEEWARTLETEFRRHEDHALQMTKLRALLETLEPAAKTNTLTVLRNHRREVRTLAAAVQAEDAGPLSPGLEEDVAEHLHHVTRAINRRLLAVWFKRGLLAGSVAILAGGLALFLWASNLLANGPKDIQKQIDEGRLPTATSQFAWLQRLQRLPFGGRPEVAESIPKLDAQIRRAEGARDAYAGRLDRLTAWAENGFTGHSLSQLLQEYDALQADRKAVATGYLPGTLKAEGVLRKYWQDYLTAQRENSISLLRESLRELGEADGSLTAKKPAEVRALLQQLRPRMEVMRQLRSPALAGLSLPQELLAEAATVEATWQPVFDSMQTLDTGLARMKEATTLEEYLAALQPLATLPWTGFPETKQAQAVLALKPTLDGFLGALISPDHPELVRLAGAKNPAPFYPAAPNEEESARYVELRDDPALGGLYRCVITTTTGSRNTNTRPVFAKGKPQRKDSVIGDKVLRKEWAAELYDPARSPESVSFEKTSLVLNLKQLPVSGQQMLEETLTSESEHFQRTGLAELATASGDAFQGPVLKVIDAVRGNPDINPLFKAYLQLQLTGLAQLRPSEWGLWLTPGAVRDAAELETLTGGGLLKTDWLSPKRNDALRDKLSRFYERTAPLSYLKEAAIHQQAIRTMARSGLQLAGFAGPDGTPVLRAGLTGATRLWGYAAEGQTAELLLQQEGTSWKVVRKPLPLTPLLTSSLDPASVWKQACEASQANPNDPLLAKGRPPIFP